VGTVSRTYPVSVTYSVVIDDLSGEALWLENEIEIDAGDGHPFIRSAVTLVNGDDVVLPLILKN
jgi:hypothetical protein